MRKKYKKIQGDERFVVSDEAFIYEKKPKFALKQSVSYRRIQPAFEGRFWEVYALHRPSGLYYAFVGKFGEKRIFFSEIIFFSHVGIFAMPIGRDLAMREMDSPYWQIFSYREGKLVETTKEFLLMPNLLITSVVYLSPVVIMTQKSPVGGQYELKAYWKQLPKGYKQIEEKDIMQTAKDYSNLPEDPLFQD